MSLWEKWERERLKKMGVDVEYEGDVEIHDTHPKANVRKQAWVVGGAVLACLIAVYFALAVSGVFESRWSDLFIVRFFAERAEQRAVQQPAGQ